MNHRPSTSLKRWARAGAAAFAEILAIAAKTAEGVISGNYSGAATSFVDYWGGRGRMGRAAAVRAGCADALDAQSTARFSGADG
jgi:hypothetical protein